MKIILPGGAGLVGQNLVMQLKRKGYNNLVVLDKHKANLAILKQIHPDITAEYVDLAEHGDWEKYFEGADVVVMLQAQIGAPTEAPFIRNNIRSTELVLSAMKAANVPYLVHISSSVVNSVANDFYTQTKTKQEEIVLNSGVKNVVLRPTLMFGHFDRKHLGWLSRFMKKFPVFPIPGHGKYMRQPLYVNDFCDIIISCVKNTVVGGVYNITGQEQIDYIDMIRAVKDSTNAKTHIIRIPYRLFNVLLKTWSVFDKNPPFTTEQLQALVVGDEFEVIDWPTLFDVKATPFAKAISQTFNDSQYSRVTLEF